MKEFLSPVALNHLQAFRYWLRAMAPEWDTSLPRDELVEPGQLYPPFHLYRHGASVGMCRSPTEVLEKIGDAELLEEYIKLTTEDPDDPGK
jgi:hypothetical protein